jgi:hypothetical protein
MIGTIRKHQQWLWIVVIVATILSFLIYFTPNSRNRFMEPGRSGVFLGTVFGEPVTPEQFQAARQEARIFFRRTSGEWPDSEARRKEVQSFTEQRLLLNAEMDQFHIVPTVEAAARYTKMYLGVNPDQAVSAERILEELAKLAHEGGVTLEDFDRFARHQVAQDYLMALLGMSGQLITPQEAEVFYRRENAPMETELVTFNATNYYAAAAPAEKDIEDFYTKRQADYRLPDRIQINYIELKLTNYAAGVEKQLGTNFNDHVEQEYLRAGPASFKDEDGVQLSAEAAKARIKKQILQYAALGEATKEAHGLIAELSKGHDEEHPYTPGDLAALAKARKLAVQTTEPFDLKTGPKDLSLSPKYLRLLFSLRDDDPDDKERLEIYATSPLQGGDAVYVAGLQKRFPSQAQPPSAVHDRVAADCQHSKALELAREAGKHFETALDAGLSQGKTFDTMCAAQFVRPRRLSPFSLTSASIPEMTDKAEFEPVAEVAGKMQPGQCSPFIPTASGGFVLYYKTELPVDRAAEQRELPGFLAQMRLRLQVAAFNQWFTKEQALHLVPPPGDMSAGGG